MIEFSYGISSLVMLSRVPSINFVVENKIVKIILLVALNKKRMPLPFKKKIAEKKKNQEQHIY